MPEGRHVPVLAVAAVVLAVGLLSAGSADARRSCKVRGAKPLVQSLSGRIVFRGRPEGVDEVFGCLNRLRRPFLLASLDFTSAYAEGVALPQLASPHAAFARVGSGPAGPCYSRVLVFDLRTGRERGRTPAATSPSGADACGQVDALALSRRGGVAWIVHTAGSATAEVHKLDVDGAQLLDSGNVERESLALSRSGRTIYWIKDGTPRSATLKRAAARLPK